jgi:hypothetical protein
MSKDTRNYYERELEQINFNGEHPAKILIGSEGKTTRTLDINKESAVALIHKLTAFLIAPEPKEEPSGYVAPAGLAFILGWDRNGNKTLRVGRGGRGFTIQTNGNLPQTHRCGVVEATAWEVADYVGRYGTKRQKAIMGL